MARNSKSSKVVHSQLTTAVLNALEPVAVMLDKDHPAEMGHAYPSTQDRGLQILIGNFCRDCYQQIYGAPATKNYQGFPGIKDMADKAALALDRHFQHYDRNGDLSGMEADPNTIRIQSFYDITNARLEALTDMLNAFKDAYRQMFGVDWEYVAPGTVRSTTSPADAVARIKAVMEKRKQTATLLRPDANGSLQEVAAQ
jgi:hypothetical protein